MAAGLLTVYLYSNYFESPKELILKNEVKELEFYYEKLSKDVTHLSSILENVEYRDDNIYRVVLGAEPIEKSVRHAGVGGVERYKDIKQKDFSHKDMVVELHEKVDRLRRKLYIESKSQDEVVVLAEKKEKQSASIPAIQP